MQLEIITGRQPRLMNYLDPNMPAGEFARFLALVKSGHPFMGTMVIEDAAGRRPPVMEEALKEQHQPAGVNTEIKVI